jgi:copper homeostasis protein
MTIKNLISQPPRLLEVCAGSLTSALNAQTGGAHRIELCDNLNEGGTTPSPGVMIQAVKLLKIPVFVLIRPRPGDFLYSEEEFEAMKEDILFCKGHGVKGVVVGILRADGSVDMERMMELVTLARPMQVTFHRAFDSASDPFGALEEIINLGIERILTSGQAETAVEGTGLLSELIKKADNRIIIMPGSGITEQNVSDLIKATGAREVHASLRSPVKSRMEFRNRQISNGKEAQNELDLMETDPEKVREVCAKLKLI